MVARNLINKPTVTIFDKMAKMQKSMVTDREEIYTEDNYV